MENPKNKHYKKHELPYTKVNDNEIIIDGSKYILNDERTIIKRISKFGEIREFKFSPKTPEYIISHFNLNDFDLLLREIFEINDLFQKLVIFEAGSLEPKIVELYKERPKTETFSKENIRVLNNIYNSIKEEGYKYFRYAPYEVYEFAERFVGNKLNDVSTSDFHVIFSRDQTNPDICLNIKGRRFTVKGIRAGGGSKIYTYDEFYPTETLKGNVVISCIENSHITYHGETCRFSHEILIDLLKQCLNVDSNLNIPTLDLAKLNHLYRNYVINTMGFPLTFGCLSGMQQGSKRWQ